MNKGAFFMAFMLSCLVLVPTASSLGLMAAEKAICDTSQEGVMVWDLTVGQRASGPGGIPTGFDIT